MHSALISSLIKRSFCVFSVIVLAVFFLVPAPKITAQIPRPPCSAEQDRVNGVLITNCSGDSFCPAVPSVTPATAVPPGSRIYMLGDSITFLSEEQLTAAFDAASLPIVKINADGGRAFSSDTDGNDGTAFDAVTADATLIGSANVMIVALGTNSGNEDLSVQIPAMISAINATGFTGKLYFVELFYTAYDGPGERNAVITAQSQVFGYSIIPTISKNIELRDQIHPSQENGKTAFANAIISGLTIPTPNSQTQPGDSGLCQCSNTPAVIGSLNTSVTFGRGVWGAGSEIYRSGLTGPYTIEQWAIHVLKNISRKAGVPESQMVTEDKVVSLIAWAKAEGGGVDGNNGTFNPLNTKLDHGDLQGTNQGNAATDSNSQGYPTFDLGVEAITRGLFGTFQKRIGSALLQPNFPQDALIIAIAGDFYSPDGDNVINRLENIYPGDKAYATLSITGFNYGGGIGNRDRYISIKRDTLRSARENYAAYASKVLDGSPPGTPAPLVFGPSGSGEIPSTNGNCSQEATGGGNVNEGGYAFPLAPQTKSGISGMYGGHHDGTPAFDLTSSESADVYALSDGVAVKVNTAYKDVPGCTTVQFKSNDGFYYFYAHLKEPTIQENIPVKAGDKIAKVADASFDPLCYGGGPHLHIDRGCTTAEGPQWGGLDECRDPNFVPFLQQMYEGLP